MYCPTSPVTTVPSAFRLGDRRPDEGHRIPGLRVGDAPQVPDDILGRHGRAVLPCGAVAHHHADAGLVVAGPALLGQEAGAEAQVRVLVDVLVEHALVDRHELRVDRRQAGRRIPGRQGHVVGDGQGVADGGRRRAVEQQRAEAGGGGRARDAGGDRRCAGTACGRGGSWSLPHDSVVYSASPAGALSAHRRIRVLDGRLSSSIFCVVATPATGRSFGSSTPIWASTDAWSQ